MSAIAFTLSLRHGCADTNGVAVRQDQPGSRTRIARRNTTARDGFTLVEMSVSLAITSVLVVGLASAIIVSSRSLEVASGDARNETNVEQVLQQICDELRIATMLFEVKPGTVAFQVPDRDGDLTPEIIAYNWSGKAGDALYRTYNNGSPAVVASGVHELDFTLVSRTVPEIPGTTPTIDPSDWGYFSDGAVNLDILMVVLNPLSLNAQEEARKTLFEGWGHVVSVIDQDASAAEFDAAFESADLVYVPEDASSGAIGNNLNFAPIGVVSEEINLIRRFGLGDDWVWRNVTQIGIDDNTHPITDSFATGALDVFTTSQSVALIEAPIVGDVQDLGIDASGNAFLATLDTGELREDSNRSPARRVQLPWGGNDFDINALTSDGQTILEEALLWGGGGKPAQFGHEDVYPTKVEGVDEVQIATRVWMPETGEVFSITLYTDGEFLLQRYAIYSDWWGEPGSLLAETDVAIIPNGDGWYTLDLQTPVTLSSGRYWLACAFMHGEQEYYHQAGGRLRYKNWDAVSDGFLSTWGTSSDSFGVEMSIYANYVPQ